ncbi:hypothetical protein [Microbulbifer sediminum]|uniref:hypothetical protein n=1 Tax=Microbulbifer sediminum TaxID=2904250 RepID=UPI001F31BB01|nr:hypothetical protein [Microbulbifer sediminum]
MRKPSTITGGLLALALAGCNSPLARGGDVPAVRATVTGAGTAELQEAVSEALGDVPVTLSERAFADSSLLIIEHSPPRSLQQPHPGGREMQPPVRFRLWLGDGHCWLQRLPDGERRRLAAVSCVPEQAAE